MPIKIEYHDEETGETWQEESLLDPDDCKEVLWTHKELMSRTAQIWPTLAIPPHIKRKLFGSA